jgi:hypothetical protein
VLTYAFAKMHYCMANHRQFDNITIWQHNLMISTIILKLQELTGGPGMGCEPPGGPVGPLAG